ncbi:hypothetical protein BN2476_230381 [Paraburkholderia piptadeniae]|uniref:DUF4435 domain-containing protein n=1 Tax=Paraburkholderia piptadeniae TaxID=1701573 RepID=A0A1N7RY90_9BURK|nr:DUF4435 domain-containing protein [Paraburkholderia piptadeniae]SIT40090.1 hypothetical protein BN2476_230381 [Paraburkholderia piptadeniae]
MSKKGVRAVPQYSEAALYGRDILLKATTDCFFYFEDAGQEPLYDRFVRMLFPSIKRVQVLCLGGCSQVIKKIRSENVLGVPRIGIIDLDYGDLLGDIVDINDLIYFEKHCFENYMINLSALLNTAIEHLDPPITYGEAEEKVRDYGQFHTRLIDRYTSVTRYFLVARRERLSISTTKISAAEMVDSDISGVADEWFDAYKEKFLAACEDNHPHLQDTDILQEQLDAAFEIPVGGRRIAFTSPDDHLSGKHLLYFMTHFIDKRLGSNLLDLGVLNRYLKLLKHVPVDSFERIVGRCWESLGPQINRFGAHFQVPEEYRSRPEDAAAAAA